MDQKKMRIGQLAQHLNVERFVIRYWEKAFGIHPQRSSGGQRFYSHKDVKKFQTIQHLLYEKKFTIAGAQKVLHNHSDTNAFTASEVTSLTQKDKQESHKQTHLPDDLKHNLKQTRDALQKISTLLHTHHIIKHE